MPSRRAPDEPTFGLTLPAALSAREVAEKYGIPIPRARRYLRRKLGAGIRAFCEKPERWPEEDVDALIKRDFGVAPAGE